MATVEAMEQDPKALFRKRLRRLRKAAKLSLEKAAERGGMDYNYWGEVERGKSEPGLEYIFRMAKGLQMPPSALFTDKEDDPNLLKKTEALIQKATPEQLALLHRFAKMIVG